jgi:pyruvate dehydrogenase E1 component alpha subunit
MKTADELIAFEQRVAEAFNAGRIRAPVHLAGGNEDALIEIFSGIRPQDWVLTTWRSHYHCLLKGVPEEVLFADILAGRSITLNYPEQRVLSSAIVGGICPIAVGIAMAIRRHALDERVYCFVGDMTARTGAMSECVKYAMGHDLPVTFVVEDNGISVCTPTEEVWGGWTKSRTPAHFGIAEFIHYQYKLPWPHSGAGKRVEF